MPSSRDRDISRRRFLTLAGAAPLVGPLVAPFASRFVSDAAAASKIPVGVELYTVRDELKKDPMGTVRAIAKLGYEVVEFYSPYFDWTPQQASEMRKLLDDLGIRCLSTHNNPASFAPDGMQKAIDLNQTIGSKLIVMASAGGRVDSADGWKRIADQLNAGAEKFKAAGMSAGFHNHASEWKEVDGKRPMDVLASSTSESVVLQLDVGTCIEAGSDPVAWINAHPGRIKSMHCKDWGGPDKGYSVLFGEGVAPWPAIFKAAESTGGIECYLIEQEEGPADQQLQRAGRCLENWKKMKAS
jgi:sugar phosphate isomerase/epimerase